MERILVIGGTGTLGREITRYLLNKNPDCEIHILSRDEQKQQVMKKEVPTERVKFHLGDIRSKESIARVFHGIHKVFHVAALKHIDVLEENPMESVRTNILGTENVAYLCIENGIPVCAFSSTDKACEPINAYGASKYVSEKCLLRLNEIQSTTKFQVFRWGNILFSNGSALHYFKKCLEEKIPINITDVNMTRFWIRIEDAVEFMMDSLGNSKNQVHIPDKMRAFPLMDVIIAMSEIMGLPFKYTFTGLRRGEKLHESILPGINSKNAKQYGHSEFKELIRPFLKKD